MLNFTQYISYCNTLFTSPLGINILEKSASCSGSNYFLTDFLITFFSLNNISPALFLFQSVSFLEINNILVGNFIGIVSELFFLTSLSMLFIYSMFMFEDYVNFAKPKLEPNWEPKLEPFQQAGRTGFDYAWT